MSRIKTLLLLIGDVIILYVALWLTLSLRYFDIVNAERWRQHLVPFSILFAIWLVIFFINRLYDLRYAQNNIVFYRLVIYTLIWCGAVGFVFFYLATAGITPKTVLVMDLIIFAVIFLWWRKLFNKLIVREKMIDKASIVGQSKESRTLAAEINQNQQMGLKIISFIAPNDLFSAEQADIQIVDSRSNIKKYLQENKIKTLIIDEAAIKDQRLINKIYNALDLKMAIFDLPEFAEKFTGKILISTIGQMWFLENIRENTKHAYEIIKRIMDIALSMILLIISLPFIPFIYILIRATSNGPGFFMQQRTGKNGKKFMAVKFRTMYQNSESSGPQWAQKNDPRVTNVGKILRKSRIDEIPQLINVLRGEMSFIGPRPERPEFIEKLQEEIPFYNTRLLVKPGLTGWAQVNFPYGASEEDALEKLQYDLYYIKNRSPILDFSILLKTIKTVLSGGGQ